VDEPREYPILVPHSAYGDPECCGIIVAVEIGERADLECNECGVVIKSVPANVAESTLIGMSTASAFCAEICPACGELNTFPGFDSMLAFTCRHCGIGVNVAPEEAELHTGISPACQAGSCGGCTGFAEHEGQVIFCIHECHKMKELD
jgi:hypothetical protein